MIGRIIYRWFPGWKLFPNAGSKRTTDAPVNPSGLSCRSTLWPMQSHSAKADFVMGTATFLNIQGTERLSRRENVP